jgi:hypothetical protein
MAAAALTRALDDAMRHLHTLLEPLCSAASPLDVAGRPCSGAKMLIVFCLFLLAKYALPPAPKRPAVDMHDAFRPFMPPDDAPAPGAPRAAPPPGAPRAAPAPGAPGAAGGVKSAEAGDLRRRT